MRIVFILLVLLGATEGYAQKESDNKALVDEFTKVMSFGSIVLTVPSSNSTIAQVSGYELPLSSK